MGDVLIMNDFTKEDLILMYHNFAETEFRGKNKKLNAIRDKIQSMIDNYCEHQASAPLMALIKECVKCHDCLDHRRWEFSEEWKT